MQAQNDHSQYEIGHVPRLHKSVVRSTADKIFHPEMATMVLHAEYYYAAIDIRDYWISVSAVKPSIFDDSNYDHKAETDKRDPSDFTSYVERQKTWGPAKENMAPILLQKTPYAGWRSGGKAPIWVVGVHCVQGTKNVSVDQTPLQVKIIPKVVIDALKARPLRFFDPKIMPLKVSRKIEGWRMEQIQRLDGRIETRDFVQRMGPKNQGKGRSRTTTKSIDPHALYMRRRRFIAQNGLVPWQQITPKARDSVNQTVSDQAETDQERTSNQIQSRLATEKPHSGGSKHPSNASWMVRLGGIGASDRGFPSSSMDISSTRMGHSRTDGTADQEGEPGDLSDAEAADAEWDEEVQAGFLEDEIEDYL